MRIEKMSSGLYSVMDSANKIVLANVSKHLAMLYLSGTRGNNKKRKK